MNKARRKAIASIVDRIDALHTMASGLCDEEQEYIESMPDSIRDSEKGDRATECADALEEAVSLLSDAMDKLNEACE